MRRVLVLDSSPLGLVTQPAETVESVAISEWMISCLNAGDLVVVPAIVYYEVRRELLRAQKSRGLVRLEAFVNQVDTRYLPLTDAALRLASQLWAETRRAGKPTSDSSSLDIDVILAAQTLLILPENRTGQIERIVVTSNARHLALFVDARPWHAIAPHA